jgi:1-acyl-sn-glycerol-3-phosphate acyltransferase
MSVTDAAVVAMWWKGTGVDNAAAHRFAREKGISKPVYGLTRAIIVPLFRTYFRMRIDGADHIPREGAAVIAPNHKSFYDAFFIALTTPRPMRFMAKAELIEPWYGAYLVRLGAFPVRRGESDEDALETAREVLRQGGLLALFPEGTRIRDPDSLGEPKRGAARLALEEGAPIVPAAITGTDHLFLGPLPKPKRVQVAFEEPVPVSALPSTPEAAGELIEEHVWPEVERSWRRLRSRTTVAAALLAAAGVGGGVAARRRQVARRKPSGRLQATVRGLGLGKKKRRGLFRR